MVLEVYSVSQEHMTAIRQIALLDIIVQLDHQRQDHAHWVPTMRARLFQSQNPHNAPCVIQVSIAPTLDKPFQEWTVLLATTV